jgi:ABC-2 type transport system ATP-binding protein
MDNNRINENVIELKSLTKKFGKQKEIVAVDSLSLEVKKGEVFGFVGPNGAGKTTTMKMMIGLLEPTSGTGKVAGFDIVREVIRIREATGVLPEPAGFYDHLTARQNLRFYAKLYDIEPDVREKRIIEILNLVGLEKAIDQKIGGFSTGMRKRFGLAQALINEPNILFLDEPTSGVDPMGAQMMRDLVKHLSKEKGVTIFLSSHSMAEVEEICDRIAIMEKGKLVALGTVEELRNIVRQKDGVKYVLEVSDIDIRDLAGQLGRISAMRSIGVDDGMLHLHTEIAMHPEIAKYVKSMGGTITRFEEEKMDLQKVFMRLIEA